MLFPVERDPTHSNTLQKQMGVLYRKIILLVRKRSEEILFGPENQVKIVQFAKPKTRVSGLSATAEQRLDNAVNLVNTPEVRNAVVNAVRRAYLHGTRQATQQASRVAGKGGSAQQPIGATPLPAGLVPGAKLQPRFRGMFVSEDVLRELVNVNVSLVKSIAQRYLSHLKVLVAKTIAGGKLTVDQLRKEIRSRWRLSNAEAARVARTEVIRAVNTGKARTFLGMGFKYWQWVSAQEGGTCDVCTKLHGKVTEIGTPFGISKYKNNELIVSPPDPHPNCRCTIVPAYRPQKRKAVIKGQLSRIMSG